mmetsp:Transcript_11038/g.23947  ORF Transcript_11038/g.23947 Transcript_11038/m.23947 type:complete len:292 (+) Transcript_11038:111-986(+)
MFHSHNVALPTTSGPNVARRGTGAVAGTLSLNRSDESLARELKGSQVGHSDDVSSARGIEDDVKGVEQTIVGEDLVLLLEVIGAVQQLNLSIKLTGVRVQEDLNLVDGGIEVNRVHGSSLDVTPLVVGEEVSTLLDHARTSVCRGSVEGEVTGSGVVDIDGGGLVTGADERLDRAHHPVLSVGLNLHGGPVGSDPELDEGLNGAAIRVNADLNDLLVGVGELPVLARGSLDAYRSADRGDVPLGRRHGEGGLGGGRSRCVDGEGIGRGGGESDEEAGDELHGVVTFDCRRQ